MNILLTGAGGSAAFNFRDALAVSGNDYRIVAADMKPYHLELLPADARYLVPAVSDPGYLDALNGIVIDEEIDFVHAQPDVEVAFLAEHGGKLAARTFLPDPGVLRLCQDKMSCNTHLAAVGVPVPSARRIGGPAALRAALDELTVAQQRVWLRAVRGAGARASLPVASAYQGEAWIDYWRSFRGLDYDDFMVSEFLPGNEYAWQSLWRDGNLVTSQARMRIEYVFGNLTPSGQSSSPSVAKTVHSAAVNSAAEAAVRAVSEAPHGVFCVDLKCNDAGEPMVTEINAGRFFTTSNFFAHAGLNMPDMYVRLGLGGELAEPPLPYDPLPEGLHWVRMIDMGYRLVHEFSSTRR